jgi:hypothetical protein
VRWRLVTTLPVTDLAQAQQAVAWYAWRWLIARFHFVVKGGCRLETLQLESTARPQRALATYDLVAWRWPWLTYQARSQPDRRTSHCRPADEVLVLYRAHFPSAVQFIQPPTLQQAVGWFAQLGGFLGRTGDGRPAPIGRPARRLAFSHRAPAQRDSLLWVRMCLRRLVKIT